jgi:hypothetical protein
MAPARSRPVSPFRAVRSLIAGLGPAFAPASALRRAGLAACLAASAGLGGCDSPSAPAPEHDPVPMAPPSAPAAPPAPPRAPEIILDHAGVAVGPDHVAAGDAPFADKVAAALAGKPGVEGQGVDVVAMRNAKPSQVVAVAGAVHVAKASGVVVKTSARDDTTQKLALTFASSLPDCTVVAWIDKEGGIDVWPAGGGAAKRVKRGLAGPDMTLGIDLVRTQWQNCESPAIVTGADDVMTWGLVFDLAQLALTAPGTRASAAALVTNVTPGKKVALP